MSDIDDRIVELKNIFQNQQERLDECVSVLRDITGESGATLAQAIERAKDLVSRLEQEEAQAFCDSLI
jgi:predicted translin family RNA/ssDNA-binding protein